MKREFIYTKLFLETWKELDMLDESLRKLEIHLMVSPEEGSVIEGSGGLRKLRWAIPGKGKSGGIRVLYADFKTYGIILMVLAYPKSKMETISDTDKAVMKQLLGQFKRSLSGG